MEASVDDIVIFGAGGWAREVFGILTAVNQQEKTWHLRGFLDADKTLHGRDLLGIPILGDHNWLRRNRGVAVVVGIGRGVYRKDVVTLLKSMDLDIQFPTLIHPAAIVGPEVELGEGTVMHANSAASISLKIGRFGLINYGVIVGHESTLGDFVTAHPNSSILGNVTLEEGAEVSASSCIIPGITVGAWSVIGAGSVVVKDVEPYTVNVGVPAKTIKRRAV